MLGRGHLLVQPLATDRLVSADSVLLDLRSADIEELKRSFRAANSKPVGWTPALPTSWKTPWTPTCQRCRIFRCWLPARCFLMQTSSRQLMWHLYWRDLALMTSCCPTIDLCQTFLSWVICLNVCLNVWWQRGSSGTLIEWIFMRHPSRHINHTTQLRRHLFMSRMMLPQP